MFAKSPKVIFCLQSFISNKSQVSNLAALFKHSKMRHTALVNVVCREVSRVSSHWPQLLSWYLTGLLVNCLMPEYFTLIFSSPTKWARGLTGLHEQRKNELFCSCTLVKDYAGQSESTLLNCQWDTSVFTAQASPRWLKTERLQPDAWSISSSKFPKGDILSAELHI